jgi:hypothetical protein
VTDCNFLAYSCAAARDSHPLPSPSVLTRLREPDVLEKNETQQMEIYACCSLKVNKRGVAGSASLHLES